jgi:hypothetical protein
LNTSSAPTACSRKTAIAAGGDVKHQNRQRSEKDPRRQRAPKRFHLFHTDRHRFHPPAVETRQPPTTIRMIISNSVACVRSPIGTVLNPAVRVVID